MEESTMQKMDGAPQMEMRHAEGEQHNNRGKSHKKGRHRKKMKMNDFSMPFNLAPNVKKNRGKLDWPYSVWQEIDKVVMREFLNSCLPCKILPTVILPEKQSTFRSNTINITPPLSIVEEDVRSMVELQVSMVGLPIQVDNEPQWQTINKLARVAAHAIGMGVMVMLIDGERGTNPTTGHALYRGPNPILRITRGTPGTGLIGELNNNLPIGAIVVENNGLQGRWGENAFTAINEARSQLESGVFNQRPALSFSDPFFCILHSAPFADSFRPLGSTMNFPAIGIQSLIGKKRFFGTSLVGENAEYFFGIVGSLAAQTIKMVISESSRVPVTEFLTEGPNAEKSFKVGFSVGFEQNMLSSYRVIAFRRT